MADVEETDKKSVGWKEITGGGAAAVVGGIAGGQFMDAEEIASKYQKAANAAGQKAKEAFEASTLQPVSPVFGAGEEAVKAHVAATQGWVNDMGKAMKNAQEPIMDKAWDLANPIKRPLMMFKEGSTKTRLALTAAVVLPAAVIGYAVHKFRNKDSENAPTSFAAREQQRRAANVAASQSVGR